MHNMYIVRKFVIHEFYYYTISHYYAIQESMQIFSFQNKVTLCYVCYNTNNSGGEMTYFLYN